MKNYLTTGNIVQFTNGFIGVVIGKAVVGEHGGTPLSDINLAGRDRDVKKIFEEPSNATGYTLKSLLNKVTNYPEVFNCLWEETEEMTLEQVCKELGRSIKIIKG